MEVPTIISYSSLLQRTDELIVDIPVPGRGGGGRGGIQGSHPGQSSTAPQFSGERIPKRIVGAEREYSWRSSRFTPSTGFNSVFVILSSSVSS